MDPTIDFNHGAFLDRFRIVASMLFYFCKLLYSQLTNVYVSQSTDQTSMRFHLSTSRTNFLKHSSVYTITSVIPITMFITLLIFAILV